MFQGFLGALRTLGRWRVHILRAVDVKDLGSRLRIPPAELIAEPIAYPEKTILIGDELTASMLGDYKKKW